MQQWQLQEAKAKLSDVINKAQTLGPQDITVRGQSKAVIISRDDFDSLTKPKKSFVQLMQQSPLKGVDLNLERDRSAIRDIDL